MAVQHSVSGTHINGIRRLNDYQHVPWGIQLSAKFSLKVPLPELRRRYLCPKGGKWEPNVVVDN
jgi:hypothetical protein